MACVCGKKLNVVELLVSADTSQFYSRPLTYVKLRNSGNPLLISHDFCYFCSGQRTRLSLLGFVIEANLFRNLLKAFLSLFIQTAYHLKFSVFDKALAP